MRYSDLNEAWLTAVDIGWRDNELVDLYIDPGKTEFFKLMREWGCAARALVTEDGHVILWHMDHGLHTEIWKALKARYSFVDAHLILDAPSSHFPIVWNELENYMNDDGDDFDNDEADYRPELRREWTKVVNNPVLSRIYGKVVPMGLNEPRDGPEYQAMTAEWLDANIAK